MPEITEKTRLIPEDKNAFRFGENRAEKYLVQYSGGIGSFAAAYYLVKEYSKESVSLLFSDTKIEDLDLYRFLRDTVDFLGCEFHYVADGRTPWQVFEDVGFIGNSRVDPCSRILKREICKKFVLSKFQPGEICIALGIDWTEKHRVKNFTRWWNPYETIAPLCNPALPFDKIRFTEFMGKELGIKAPRLYSLGFPHNNCGGFCVKAGKGQFANLYRTMPDRYAEHAEAEKSAREKIGTTCTIMKESVNNEMRYITMEAFGRRIQAEELTEEEESEIGGCGCFSDIGEDELK